MCAVDQSRVQAIDGAEAIKIDFNAIVRFSKRNTSQRVFICKIKNVFMLIKSNKQA